MAWTVRVSHNYLQVRNIEWEIVITTVPQDDIDFLLSLAQNFLVIPSGVNDHPVVDVGFIFLTFLNGALLLVEISIRGESLDGLLHQVTVRHGVADGCHFITHAAQDQRYTASSLALA